MKFTMVSLVTALLSSSVMAHPCDDGTAPAGWLRDGGYCDLRDNLKSTVTEAGGGLDPYSDIYFPLADGDPNS